MAVGMYFHLLSRSGFSPEHSTFPCFFRSVHEWWKDVCGAAGVHGSRGQHSHKEALFPWPCTYVNGASHSWAAGVFECQRMECW